LNKMYRTLRKTVKQMLQHTWLAEPIGVYLQRRRSKAQKKYWIARGQSPPPPHRFKAEVLRQYAVAYGLRILVETGTQTGQMLAALKHEFARLYSIELLPENYEKARQRFLADPQIELTCGDSAAVLPAILARLREPALFWLDGHYSPNSAPAGEQVTPILAELAHLFAAPRLGHVIIIDDVRLFDTHFGYPPLAEVLTMIEQDGGWAVLISDDSIRLTPRQQKPLSLDLGQDESAHG
jgi:hypothetical protein